MLALRWLEISGFRSFSVVQRLEFTQQLGLIWGGNSQGKTSFAEAFEFLLTGTVVRRELLGGEKYEYDSTLRCAHHPEGEPTFVRAGIVDTTGTARTVCRTLEQDFGRGQDCSSTLTVDDVQVSDLESLGFPTGDPPLRAPVLMQHSLRFALSAKPSDRLAYFKSILEITDLDALTRTIATAAGPLATINQDPRELDYAACLADALYTPVLSALERGLPQTTEVLEELRRAAATAIQALSGADELPQGDLEQLRTMLDAQIENQANRVFDFDSWRPAQMPESIGPASASLEPYVTAQSQVEAEVERLSTIFEAVLSVPAYADLADATKCPVCETPDALTVGRIDQMRSLVAANATFRAAQSRAAEEVRRKANDLRSLKTRLEVLTPASSSFDQPAVDRASETASRVLDRTADLTDAARASASLAEAARAACRDIDAAVETHEGALASINAALPLDLSQNLGFDQLAERLGEVTTRRTTALEEAAKVLRPLREVLNSQASNSVNVALVRLLGAPEESARAIRARRARSIAASEFSEIQKDFDRAKLGVLTEKFSDMSTEIVSWWNLLRPSEPVSFKGASPRGQGKRSVALTAELRAEGSLELRDALGVFSDSQLNALGLSAFLARVILRGNRIVLLDDPVQSGDDQHRDTFIDLLIPELLARGIQVIVSTFDYRLNQYLTNAQELDGFTVSLDTPAIGSIILKGTDTAQALLREAKGFIQETASLRATGAGRLRVAAEAAAKEILVHKRLNAGERPSLADYNGWTLEKLVPCLEPHLADDKERGRWRNIRARLNPGAHHDIPPEMQTLKLCYGQLMASHKLHVPV